MVYGGGAFRLIFPDGSDNSVSVPIHIATAGAGLVPFIHTPHFVQWQVGMPDLPIVVRRSSHLMSSAERANQYLGSPREPRSLYSVLGRGRSRLRRFTR